MTPGTPDAPGSIRVLLIEDNPGDARLIQEALAEVQGQPFALVWVKRLAEGLDRLAAQPIDIVLLDLSLPDSQGLEGVGTIQGKTPAMPVIILTGLDDEALAIEAVKKGAQDYLGKAVVQVDSSFLARAIRYAIERQRIEEAIRASEQRFQIVARATNDAVWDWDLKTNQVWWNEAIQTRFKYSPTQVKPDLSWWSEQIHPEESERIVAGIHAVIAGGGRFWSSEYRFRRGDGTFAYVFDRGYVVQDEQGRPVRMIGAMMDITERKQAEQSLARLASFAERNPDPVIEIDANGTVTYLNSAASAKFPELTKAERGHPVLEGLSAVMGTLQRTGQQAFVREIAMGDHVYEQHISYVAESRVIRSYIIDITDRKQVERLKDEFISTVSHELRTPLATIKEFIAIIADEIAGPTTPDQKQYLGIIKTNIDRLARMINDVLDMAKIESGRIVLNKEVVSTQTMLGQVVESMKLLAQSKQITLTINAPKFFPDIYADQDKLTQVLINLISNAIKFTPDRGAVTIGVDELETEVRIVVTDTGVGIEAKDLPRLFEKFQQFRRMSAESGSTGTGLGLAISKRFVELHGGRIWAESHAGSGSRFYISLPRYHVGEVFREYVKSALSKARRANSHLSIITIAVADFEDLRSRYGAEAVRTMLNLIERRIRDSIRLNAGDAVVRWQNGDLLVVLADIDQAGCLSVVDRIKRTAEGGTYQLEHADQRIQIMTSSATYPDSVVSEEDFLRLVESGMPVSSKPRRRILIVDDEPKIRHFLKEVLEMQGYEVLTAASGPDTLEQLKVQAVDLILLDVMMPVMDGYQVYHLLRENPQTRDVPVLIVTAQGERTDRLLGIEGPSYNYVIKPFEIEELLGKIQEMLAPRSTGRRAVEREVS